jgi:hypothetical protein
MFVAQDYIGMQTPLGVAGGAWKTLSFFGIIILVFLLSIFIETPFLVLVIFPAGVLLLSLLGFFLIDLSMLILLILIVVILIFLGTRRGGGF